MNLIVKVALIYFSATGNTLKIADVIERQLTELNVEVIKFDITSYSDRKKKIDLGPYQARIFGFPVHSYCGNEMHSTVFDPIACH